MSAPLAAGTRLGPYEISELIGAGGMGEVYRARDPRLGRQVAIKVLPASVSADAERLQRFEAEARAAGSLDHPNLIVVYDVGREGGISYIVSELLEGETLRARLRQGTLTERRTIECAAQIARGLSAAHEKGIVHRDLKPDNLFITGDHRVKLLDFGVAKLVRGPDASDVTTLANSLTDPGAVVGTVGYMAPEQVRGDAVDHRADIFALGVVMHEMLSGQPPFQRTTSAETMTAVLREEPPDLGARATTPLARVVQRCLEKRREDRFHSAHDLALALDLLTSPTTSAGQVPVMVAPPRVSRRRVLVYGASSIALLTTGFAAGGWFGNGRAPARAPSFRRLTFRRGLIRSARLAPDGQTILYGALWDGDRCRVHTVRIDSPESRALELPDANVLAVSRSGELALALGPHQDGILSYGTLARVPLAGGAPRPMLEHVKFADWSPDGSELAIVRLIEGRDRLEYPAGQVLLHPATGEWTGLGFPRISPDGRHVAFVHYRAPGSLVGRIAIVDRGGAVKTLSDEYLNVHGLTWRGQEIWYSAADDRPLFRALCAVTPRGEVRTVTRSPGNVTLWDAWSDGRLVIAQTDDRGVVMGRGPGDVDDRDLSWLDASVAEDISRDGRMLLFSEYGQGAGLESAAYLRGMDGSDAVRLSGGRALALSPDGKWAVCASASWPSPYLELVPTGAGEPRRLPGHGLGYSSARWLPDGGRLVVSATESGRRTRLYVLGLDGDPPRALTPEGLITWVVSPDGSTVAVRDLQGKVHLYPIEGSTPSELPATTGTESLVGWIDDGLLITRTGDLASPLGQIYRVDTRTGRQAPWLNILPRDRAGIMMLSSFRATRDGRARAFTWHRALSNLYLVEHLS